MKIPVFYSYSHKDDDFRKELETHLEVLRRNELIDSWSDREISPGSNWEEEINFNIQKAKIILLLISSDFIASDYCYETETIFALEQHKQKKATVIPIILRPCLWKISHFKHLQVLPKEGKAISTWNDKDSAWMSVAEGVLSVINKFIELQNQLIDKEKENREIIGQSVEKIYNIDSTGNAYFDGAGKIHLDKDDKDIYQVILEFLKKYNEWYFSPLRIFKWGGRQAGFKDLSESSLSAIKAELEKMKENGIVKTTKSKKGNTIYKLESAVFNIDSFS